MPPRRKMKMRMRMPSVALGVADAVPIYHTFHHNHTQHTSNYNPKVSLGNARVQLIQMRSELPLLSAQVKHALSHNPLFER